MRIHSHVIDTRSIKRVLDLLPDYWVIRELTERDYGIDLIVEIFEKTGQDKHGHDTFESTGAVFHAQVKGTESPLNSKNNKEISFSLKKSAIQYIEQFNTPFLLFRIDVSSGGAKSYFLWIQRYVKDVLDIENPDWRSSTQNSLTVKIPTHNEISSNLEKIEAIASRPRLIQEMLDFRDSYFHLSSQLAAAAANNFNVTEDSLKHMKLLARQIHNLKVIFKYNHCCISKKNAEDLLRFIGSLDTNSNASDFLDHPHQENFELLQQSIENFSIIENDIAENDNDTTY